MTETCAVNPGSFRDPSGFVYTRAGVLYRQVNACYLPAYRQLMDSGLYAALTEAGALVPHQEVDLALAATADAAAVLQPERVPFISYPYEWPFSALRDAALLTLRIQKMALERGMSLKDATAYNIQFRDGAPVFIDTLSFEPVPEGQPWVAYKQFCQHFLAPLALMSLTDVRLLQLLRVHLDGIPLDLASRMLPWTSKWNPGLGMHIHLHAGFQQRYADKTETPRAATMSRNALLGIIDHLESTVRGLRWEAKGTEWGAYYSDTNYTPVAFAHKQETVSAYLARVKPADVWDLGANDGTFSRLAAGRGIETVAFDIDPAAVEKGYTFVRDRKAPHLLPLVLDLTNPSPALGWRHAERASLLDRGPADLVMALALVHHLAISNNLPLADIAAFLRAASPALIIEFVPKSDSQVKRLLATREDVFPHYTQPDFEAAFARHFTLIDRTPVRESERVLYLWQAE